ncbi:MAG: hypothetical protein IH600_14485 [Bacteroidetes bacterium]|nr:hypothetical protein [Bacteroidota bacterium]
MNRMFPIAIAALLLLVAQACTFTTAHIERAVLAHGVDAESKEPLSETTSFHGSDAMLHCAVLMANTPSGTVVKARWYAILDDTQEVLDTTEITLDNSGWIDFNLTLSKTSLPYGKYAVDLFIDGKFAQTVPFTIEPEFPDGVIKEAVIARALSDSYFPTEASTSVPAGAAYVYAPVYVSGQPEGTAFGASWYQHTSDGNRATITSFEIDFDQEGWIGFSLHLPQGIPAGSYSVDLLVNGEVAHTLEFTAD